ncbi:ABC transporter permease [Jiangella ureilytica]|uniref:ABC transporter permease n=1 Tax=Jiangella ureilytica TaxID=2530374 RepID=A0A4R4RS76_9ACTN|nr:ABC transporter permease [Jiangella ureilytica]TDC52760.1 ABC transporter permease [Jiangella ureilytica]
MRRQESAGVADLEPVVPIGELEPATGRRRRRSLRGHTTGIIGTVIVVGMALAAIVGPWLLGIDPNAQELSDRLLPPWSQSGDGSTLHILGTDDLGRDVLARVLEGGRASLSVVALGVVVGCSLGMTVGITSGFRGGRLDIVLMRVVDAQLAIPLLISALLVATILGTGFMNTAVALGIASWAVYARLIRAETLKLRGLDFFEATVALGSSDRRLVFRHLIPNLISTVFVVASLEMGGLVVTESSLSYLGLGMQPPDASWGSMIRSAQPLITTAWWLAAIPGTAVMLVVLGFNLMGDWLRDVLDPQSKQRV